MKNLGIVTAASATALITASPGITQSDEVEVLSKWNYDALYEEGWSVKNMLDQTDVIDANGEDIGVVENVIFSNDGTILGVIAQVGGLWDLGDTHVHVPWDEVGMDTGIAQIQIPVTEENVDDYDVFADYWTDEQIMTKEDVDTTQAVEDDLVAGAGIFKATDLMGDFAYLSDGTRYGYLSDIIVQDGSISAIVSDARTYGRRGYYAYPYIPRGNMTSQRHDLPYDATQVDTIKNFNYQDLQSRVNP